MEDNKLLFDWRYTNQDRYLKGKVLYYSKYEKSNDKHDHCEFCMQKFSSMPYDLHEGYTTDDGYYWVCTSCFRDFQKILNLQEYRNSD